MRCSLNMKKWRSAKGFSLVELAIVMVISGLIFTPLFAMYALYIKDKELEDTQAAISLSSGEIARFQATLTRYPCPADASLPPTDPNFGRSQCAAAAGLTTPGDCTPNDGLCLVVGARSGVGNNLVLIGSVPFRTIKSVFSQQVRFADEDFLDAWNNRIMYAVSVDLAENFNNNKFYNGVISADDEFGNATAGVDDDAHYVVFSHGQDGKGAFDAFGNKNRPCGTGADSRDFENCDGDADFVQAKGYYLSTAGNTYYDDHVFFGKKVSEALWAYENDNTNIRSLFTGNVGVGTSTPQHKLDIRDTGLGELEVDNAVMAKEICDISNANCFDIEIITDSGHIQCGATGDVMEGISLADEDCTTPTFATLNEEDCAANGEWITGFKTNGEVICGP